MKDADKVVDASRINVNVVGVLEQFETLNVLGLGVGKVVLTDAGPRKDNRTVWETNFGELLVALLHGHTIIVICGCYWRFPIVDVREAVYFFAFPQSCATLCGIRTCRVWFKFEL